jgi:hypothetical protein
MERENKRLRPSGGDGRPCGFESLIIVHHHYLIVAFEAVPRNIASPDRFSRICTIVVQVLLFSK